MTWKEKLENLSKNVERMTERAKMGEQESRVTFKEKLNRLRDKADEAKYKLKPLAKEVLGRRSVRRGASSFGVQFTYTNPLIRRRRK